MWASILGSVIRALLQAYLLPILVGKVHDSALTWLVGPGADQIAAGLLAVLVILWSTINHIKTKATIAVAADSAPTTPAKAEAIAGGMPFREQVSVAFQSPNKNPDVNTTA